MKGKPQFIWVGKVKKTISNERRTNNNNNEGH